MKLCKTGTRKEIGEWNARDFFNFFRRLHRQSLGFEYPTPRNGDGWRAACVLFAAFQQRYDLDNSEFYRLLAYAFSILDVNSFDGVRSVLNFRVYKSFRRHFRKTTGHFEDKVKELYK